MHNQVQRTAEELWLNIKADGVIRATVKTVPELHHEISLAEAAIDDCCFVHELWLDDQLEDDFVESLISRQTSNPYMLANLHAAAENMPFLLRFLEGVETLGNELGAESSSSLHCAPNNGITAWSHFDGGSK